MSRARNIKPGFFKNDQLADLPFEFRILFQGLWCEADREGRVEDRPKRIKAEVFPYDQVDVDAGLDALQNAGFIVRYEAEGRRCIEVLNFSKHQNPHKKEARSSLPARISEGSVRVPEIPGKATEIPAPSRLPKRISEGSVRVPEITGQAQEIPERAGLIPDSLIPDSLIPDSLQKQDPPKPPADAGEPSGRKKTERIAFATFVQTCRDNGEKPIKPDDPIFTFADDAKIPHDFIALAWRAFSAKHRVGRKQQAGVVGWRAHFRDAVRGNWGKLWYFPSDGEEAALTTVGIALKREAEAAAARRQSTQHDDAGATA
jgi:hypothetical protein